MELKRVNIFVSGLVQGVYYRHHTCLQAQELGVKGWVKNLPDQRVEILAEGSSEILEKLTEWCYQGSPMSKVDNVETSWLEYEGNLNDFAVVY